MHEFPDHKELLCTDEELWTPSKTPPFELKDVPEWNFGGVARAKGMNRYYMLEDRCVSIWTAERTSLLLWWLAFLFQQSPLLR